MWQNIKGKKTNQGNNPTAINQQGENAILTKIPTQNICISGYTREENWKRENKNTKPYLPNKISINTRVIPAFLSISNIKQAQLYAKKIYSDGKTTNGWEQDFRQLLECTEMG